MPDARTEPLRWTPQQVLRSRTSAKWTVHPPDVLPLWIAEMDVDLAPPVAAALRDAAGRGDTGYAAGTGYARALDTFARQRWAWQVPPERTAQVADVMAGVVEVLKLVTGPGDAVVVTPPVYTPFYRFTANLGRRVVEAPLGPEGRLDAAALEAAFREAVSGGSRAAFLLCNPHNPTGTVPTAAELAEVARLSARYGVRVVSDEIHAPLVLPGAHFVPYLSVPGAEDGFAVHSASKAWNLAGLKAALVVAGKRAVPDLERLPEEVSHGPSHVGVLAHTAALREGGGWLDSLLAALEHNRRLLTGLLAEHLPQVRQLPQEGTYFAWLDCRALGLGDDPARVFLEQGRVALVSGPSFGPGGEGHVRLNTATSPETLTEAVHRMAAAVRATG